MFVVLVAEIFHYILNCKGLNPYIILLSEQRLDKQTYASYRKAPQLEKIKILYRGIV